MKSLLLIISGLRVRPFFKGINTEAIKWVQCSDIELGLGCYSTAGVTIWQSPLPTNFKESRVGSRASTNRVQ